MSNLIWLYIESILQFNVQLIKIASPKKPIPNWKEHIVSCRRNFPCVCVRAAGLPGYREPLDLRLNACCMLERVTKLRLN